MKVKTIYDTLADELDITGYYACRKCGKLSNNPPEKLIVKEKE